MFSCESRQQIGLADTRVSNQYHCSQNDTTIKTESVQLQTLQSHKISTNTKTAKNNVKSKHRTKVRTLEQIIVFLVLDCHPSTTKSLNKGYPNAEEDQHFWHEQTQTNTTRKHPHRNHTHTHPLSTKTHTEKHQQTKVLYYELSTAVTEFG
jgi:hypothetical protein